MTASAPSPALSLTDDQRARLRSLVDTVIAGARVAVFGSRATGCARPFSDVDLLILEPTHLTWQQRTALQDAPERSELP
jgi:predicted nucleotidyltransferase